jgi:hypothetical protein
VTTGGKTVDVELTEEELVKLLAWVAPESRLLPRLKAVTRLERLQPVRTTFFSFIGTEDEARELLELARVRAHGAVPRIKEGLRLVRPGPSVDQAPALPSGAE